jgi:hypothetical protein
MKKVVKAKEHLEHVEKVHKELKDGKWAILVR